MNQDDVKRMERESDIEGLARVLKENTGARHRELREVAIMALGRIGNIQAIQHLWPLLKSYLPNDEWVIAAEALGKIRDEDLTQRLLRVANRSSEETYRWSAFWALGAMGDTRALEPLVKLFEVRKNSVRDFNQGIMSTTDTEIALGVALGRLGNMSALELIFQHIHGNNNPFSITYPVIVIGIEAILRSHGSSVPTDALLRIARIRRVHWKKHIKGGGGGFGGMGLTSPEYEWYEMDCSNLSILAISELERRGENVVKVR